MSNKLRLLFSLPKTIYFNFFYLPFNQAIKLPIWLYNVNLHKMRGQVIIDSASIKPGMIKLGNVGNPLYDSCNRLTWENRGVVCFKGTCVIGHGSGISTGINGYIEIGNNFFAITTTKIISFVSIIFGDNVRVSWETIFMDTDFHETINLNTNERSIPSKPIKIGNNNWIAVRVIVLKGSETPDFTIVGANSILTKSYDIPQYSIIAGVPPKVMKTGVYRDLNSNVK